MKYIDEYKAYEEYDSYLDEQGMVKIGSLEYYPSTVLEKVDPIAYRCGFTDWLDAMDYTTDEAEADTEEEG